MIFHYVFRLFLLCFASYFLIQAALGLCTWAISPWAIHKAEKMEPRRATRFLLILRMGPSVLAALLVAVFCVPSYLWFEPLATLERVGLACSLAAFLGAAIWGISIARVLRATFCSTRYTRYCQLSGREVRLPGESSPIFVMEAETSLFALAGVIRPRIFVSSGVLRVLSQKELDAALRHEKAHGISRDNLKRLLFLLMPEVFPFSRMFAALEHGWAKFSEWNADDEATRGDAQASLSLAAALIRIARMENAVWPPLFPASHISDGRGFSERVDRLLRAKPCQPQPAKNIWRIQSLMGGAALSIAFTLMVVILRPGIFYAVHQFLERLVD